MKNKPLFGTVCQGHVCIKCECREYKAGRGMESRVAITGNIDYTKYNIPVYCISNMSVSDTIRLDPKGYVSKTTGMEIPELEKYYASHGGVKLQ